MTKTYEDTGGPAFPLLIEEEGCASQAYLGMTLRDWFAGQAMIGAFSAFSREWHNPNDYQIKAIANNAYRIADAMMEARK
jgi:hypothetical protein